MVTGVPAFHDARPKYDQAQFVDVAFSDLVPTRSASPRSVYEQFGLPWTVEVETAIEEIDRESKQGAANRRTPTRLADYGLTEDEVRARFS